MLRTALRANAHPAIDIYDPSLKLYLPLYDHAMGVSPFISKDLNHHTATVTGTTWGNQGRTFDGVDDIIDCGDGTALHNLADTITIIIWYKPTSYPTSFPRLISKEFGYLLNSFAVVVPSGVPNFYINNVATAVLGGLTLDVFSHIAFTYSKADGVAVGYLNAIAGTPVAYSTSIATTNYPVTIGSNPDLNREAAGLFGEVLIYNRALSAPEINQIYLATKWRYL